MATKCGLNKLLYLRKLMMNAIDSNEKGIQAYIVTSDDAHQSEYVQERDKRRQYISGFKGSLGTVVITQNNALLWTDGRYFTQASIELDPPGIWTLMREGFVGTPSLHDWLIYNLPSNSVVGADPNLLSNTSWNLLQNNLKTAGHYLVPIEQNLIDKVWGEDRPSGMLNKIMPHQLNYSGKIAGDKIKDCFQAMEKNNTDILVLSALDEIAYLLNWRGSDIPYNPVFFAYVILFSSEVHIFINEERITLNAKQQLIEETVNFILHSYDTVIPFLMELCTLYKNSKVWISGNSSYALHRVCSSLPIHVAVTPVSLMKLVKNDTEISGMKSAHIKDAIALVKYFSWLENKINNLTDDHSIITELSGAEQLEKFRKEQCQYVGPSFPTISAVGKHGAIVHYQPSPDTDISINNRELYLCDAGAHYLDGTTDVTRTLHFGQPTEFEKECFTRVFKGQCNLAMSIFPAMIKGNYLDTLARKYLWDVGLDYLHGTGHGVGAYLNVHEFPTMISWRVYPDDPGLQFGMFLSNEPGYYEEENFGIRLENIEMIVKSNTKYSRLNREFLTFDTVTLVPIQTRLLNISMLTEREIQFLNNYHNKCYNVLHSYLDGPENSEALLWLHKETRSISRQIDC